MPMLGYLFKNIIQVRIFSIFSLEKVKNIYSRSKKKSYRKMSVHPYSTELPLCRKLVVLNFKKCIIKIIILMRTVVSQ